MSTSACTISVNAGTPICTYTIVNPISNTTSTTNSYNYYYYEQSGSSSDILKQKPF
jgi:hypothetical protein